MNIHPNLLQHPKFQMFKRGLKLLRKYDALEYLLRLWSHCQTKQLGENWGPRSVEYVEVVADWDGEPGKLFELLNKPFCDKPGWIHIDSGNVIITGWNEHNEYLVNAWENGRKGGRPPKTAGKPAVNQPVTPPKTAGKPAAKAIGVTRGSVESGIGSEELGEGPGSPLADSLAHIPTVAEVIAFGNGPSGIPEAYCRHYHAKCEEQHRWIKNGRLIDWKKELPRWWAADRATFRFDKKTAAPDVEQLRAELDAETNPEKRAELRQKIKNLTEAAA